MYSILFRLTDSLANGLAEVAIDPGTAHILPTITIEDVDKHIADDAKPQLPDQPEPQLPGAIPSAPPPQIPDWYKVGWRAVSGIDSPINENEAKDRTILDTFIGEQFYGDWYHNAAIIVFVRINITPSLLG